VYISLCVCHSVSHWFSISVFVVFTNTSVSTILKYTPSFARPDLILLAG
jgi:hypothetical protein